MRNTAEDGKTLETIWLSSPGAGQVVAERLLDHHPAPPARVLLGQPVRAKLIDDGLEQPRRD